MAHAQLEVIAAAFEAATQEMAASLVRTAERRSAVGPALVELPGSTCWVADGWSGETDAYGTLVLRR